MTQTPATVARNRSARLVAEATTPVYSTSTPEREHVTAVEIDTMFGRHWSHMPDSDVDSFIERYLAQDSDAALSDIDHSARCWCQK